MTTFADSDKYPTCVRCKCPILPGTIAAAGGYSYHTVCVPLKIKEIVCHCWSDAEEHEPHCPLFEEY
jgi:hypothetical protein